MLEIIAFCCGALVMVLEMVGARVLAPHVGTSAVVWTSLIGVVLACLALGAWLGGCLADRHLSRRGLALILLGASLGSALAAGTHRLVGGALSAAITDIHLAAVACALGILALPALCCGMISPYIIRLRIRDVATSGATVGRLYALSTAGSIAGTFLGGFVLISFFASGTILWGVALAGVLAKMLWINAPRMLSTAVYLIMGWSVVFVAKDFTALGQPCLTLVALGGIWCISLLFRDNDLIEK